MGFTVRKSNSAYHIYHQDPGQAPHIGLLFCNSSNSFKHINPF